jgi:predicted O-methyltransferase YrrM
MRNSFFTATQFFKYYLFSRHRKGHGVHSPWVFTFVKDVLNNKISISYFAENRRWQQQLKKNSTQIEVHDLGAATNKENQKGKRVGELAVSSATPFKYRCLLGRMIQFYNPELIIELGTSLGLTTNILSNSTTHKVITVEGCPNIHKKALENFRLWNNKNIEAINSDFDSFIQSLENQPKKCFIYIDGNHSKQATLRYVEQLWSKIPAGSIMVLGDIYWSRDMSMAWSQLTVPQDNTYTVDLFHVGILFKHQGCVGQHWRIGF